MRLHQLRGKHKHGCSEILLADTFPHERGAHLCQADDVIVCECPQTLQSRSLRVIVSGASESVIGAHITERFVPSSSCAQDNAPNICLHFSLLPRVRFLSAFLHDL